MKAGQEQFEIRFYCLMFKAIADSCHSWYCGQACLEVADLRHTLLAKLVFEYFTWLSQLSDLSTKCTSLLDWNV